MAPRSVLWMPALLVPLLLSGCVVESNHEQDWDFGDDDGCWMFCGSDVEYSFFWFPFGFFLLVILVVVLVVVLANNQAPPQPPQPPQNAQPAQPAPSVQPAPAADPSDADKDADKHDGA